MWKVIKTSSSTFFAPKTSQCCAPYNDIVVFKKSYIYILIITIIALTISTATAIDVTFWKEIKTEFIISTSDKLFLLPLSSRLTLIFSGISSDLKITERRLCLPTIPWKIDIKIVKRTIIFIILLMIFIPFNKN